MVYIHKYRSLVVTYVLPASYRVAARGTFFIILCDLTSFLKTVIFRQIDPMRTEAGGPDQIFGSRRDPLIVFLNGSESQQGFKKKKL